jgi:small subunit ribosomal protein S20
MPNIKSSKKRVIVNNKKAEANKSIRSEVKTSIKKVEALIKDKNFEEAKVALANAYKVIDSAAAKNVLHANNAANKKSKIASKLEKAIKNA